MKLTCKISTILYWVGQTGKLQEKEASNSTFQAVKSGQYPIGYLMILKKLCFLNQYEQHPILYLCLTTRQLYNIMHRTNENTTNYLFRFLNAQKVNEAYNGRLATKGFQEHGMKILYPLHVTSFYLLQDDGKKEADISGEEMLCATLYLENSDKASFSEKSGNSIMAKY